MMVTLETLRADYISNVASCCGGNEAEADEWLDVIANPSLVASYGRDYFQAQADLTKSAHMYRLARDYGLKAAMAWKLSDGAMDPRKGGDA